MEMLNKGYFGSPKHARKSEPKDSSYFPKMELRQSVPSWERPLFFGDGRPLVPWGGGRSLITITQNPLQRKHYDSLAAQVKLERTSPRVPKPSPNATESRWVSDH